MHHELNLIATIAAAPGFGLVFGMLAEIGVVLLMFGVAMAMGMALAWWWDWTLGAFFAGMVLRQSKLSHRAVEESLPLRDAFSVLFFVSVGMLFDPMVLMDNPLYALGVVLVIATPGTFDVRKMVEIAKALNPSVRCVVRSHNDREASLLRAETGGHVFVGEEELANSMTRHVLETLRERKAMAH
jgi:predicted Kef-type K+ transport protein